MSEPATFEDAVIEACKHEVHDLSDRGLSLNASNGYGVANQYSARATAMTAVFRTVPFTVYTFSTPLASPANNTPVSDVIDLQS